MPYEVFERYMRQYAKTLGLRVKVVHKDGKHIARFSNGDMYTANAKELSITAIWGSGHMAQYKFHAVSAVL